jgi:hypothetical protein
MGEDSQTRINIMSQWPDILFSGDFLRFYKIRRLAQIEYPSPPSSSSPGWGASWLLSRGKLVKGLRAG